MPLPRSPRTSFDVTVDLDLTPDTRTFNSGTYNGKHVRVFGRRNIIDTRRGLCFFDCASVTIIGGWFQPPDGGFPFNSSGGLAPGTLSFTNVGDVYLEGVITDNVNLLADGGGGENGGDAIYLSGRNAETNFTAQNCNLGNVRGIETLPNGSKLAHGDIFQTASTTMGKTGDVFFYNVTGSGDYQGFFTDPQPASSGYPETGIRSLTIRRVNLKRTRQVSPTPRLSFLFSSAGNYDARGYPVTYDDFWVDGGPGQTLENTIWPNHEAGSNNFPTKYRASYGTDSKGRYATYPGLTDAGKVVSGRIYQGTPPGGDFCPTSAIFPNYQQGTDLSSSPPPPQDTAPLPAGSNLIRIANWVKGGTGTGTVNATTGAISVTPANDGTRTYFRQRIPVEIGKTYAITWDLFTSTQMWRMLGTTEGGTEIVNVNVSTFPENKITFKATTTFVWFEFNRVSAGTPTVGSVRFEEVAPGSSTARRLNGRNQLFRLDVGTAGLRKWNAIQYFGGWAKFHHLPTAGAYLLDFATPDAVASGGQQRARILWDPTASKMLASNAGVTKYAENAITGIQMKADEWHYVGMILMSDGDVKLVYDQTIGGVTSGTGIPEVAQFGTVLQLGARTGSTPTGYAPAILADWIWCAEFLPTNAQIQALAAGNRPLDIDGFTPSFYWPMVSTGPTEDSLTGAAALTATNTPITVVGPSFITPPPDEVLPLLMF